eukprot:992009-Amphidinium_carterae.1
MLGRVEVGLKVEEAVEKMDMVEFRDMTKRIATWHSDASGWFEGIGRILSKARARHEEFVLAAPEQHVRMER